MQQETGAFTRSDVALLLSLGALWIVMIALVNPVGDFPLNDDWIFARGVKSIVETGRFELPTPSIPNLLAQAYWGALFCLPFGFSFTALRFSTLTLGAAGIFALYLLLREIGSNRQTAFVGGLTLAVNPLYFDLANSFMTDVPCLMLVTTALWLFVRGVRREEVASLVAAILIALLAILVRQVVLFLLLAFACAYIMRKGATWKTLAVAILPLLVGAGLHFFYRRWLMETGRMTHEITTIHDLVDIRHGRSIGEFLQVVTGALPYFGFFVAPFLTSVAFTRPRANSRNRLLCLLVVALAALILAATHFMHATMPEFGNILIGSGLGPLTLPDTFRFGQNYPTIPAAMADFWIAMTIVGALGTAVIAIYFTDAAARVSRGLWQRRWRCNTWLETLTVALLGSYWSLLLMLGLANRAVYDRYILMFLPAVLMLAVTSESCSGSTPLWRWRSVLPLALFVVYAAFSVAATHDYLAWHRTRWMATRALMDAGVSPGQIDGGYEFNGWYRMDPNYHNVSNMAHSRVDDDEYIIASGPLSGYQELQRFGFRRWLLQTDAGIVVLYRANPEHH
jgi:4-amino-4-deoxy-L-arabinose transferase-like glycosyltransferase